MSVDEHTTVSEASNGLKKSLGVPSLNSALDIPHHGVEYTPSLRSSQSSSYRSRRTSARIMSATLRKTLRNLRRNEHKALVKRLKKKKALYYSRQRFCECITMTSFIISFTIFSFYMVLSYGFYFGIPRPFELTENLTTRIVVNKNENVNFKCQTDHPWEYCRWTHHNSFCDFERTSKTKIDQRSCDFPQNKASFWGNYSNNECGLQLHQADISDRGIWLCEMEKYYLGFSRKYGELKTFGIMLVVLGDEKESVSTSPSTLKTTLPISPVTYFSNDTEAENENMDDEKEYQRNFFFLKVFILGGMCFVLGSLALLFWLYFMFLWRSWESQGGGKILRNSFNDPSFEEYSDSSIPHIITADKPSYTNTESDPIPSELSRNIYESRRKSVSFAVAALIDKNTLNLEKKTVRLLHSNIHTTTSCSSQLCIPSIIATAPCENWEQIVFDDFNDQSPDKDEFKETVL
ncbi:uncharacterized protein [Lepeophtheirus salmonis]|uniref:uncharacterized protein n=1 Tax=Lepeophtheirus salmonis TaxID=72036 RepID=UPI001AE7B449|nr:uncharacterized protein LOC121129810 [Lepeophtheirus salmonis]